RAPARSDVDGDDGAAVEGVVAVAGQPGVDAPVPLVERAPHVFGVALGRQRDRPARGLGAAGQLDGVELVVAAGDVGHAGRPVDDRRRGDAVPSRGDVRAGRVDVAEIAVPAHGAGRGVDAVELARLGAD